MALAASAQAQAQGWADPTVDPNYSVSHPVYLSPSTTVVETCSPSDTYWSPATAPVTLPGSIVPSDVLFSLGGASMPTTLVTDTDTGSHEASPLPAEFTTAVVVTEAGSVTTRTMHVSLWTTAAVPVGSPTPTDSVTIGVGKVKSAATKGGLGEVSVGMLGLCLCIVAGIAAQV